MKTSKPLKKYLTLAIILIVLIGSIAAGGLFKFIGLVVIRPITNILFVIYNLIGDFGTAIILFTVLVKAAMWPMVKKQHYQTKLMKKLQPQLAEIKKNCNGNTQLESMQTMELYKKYNVKPLGSLLTILIQLPIFIALFSAIRSIATPTLEKNLGNYSYSFVQYEGSRISEVADLQAPYLADLANDSIPAEEKATYDFHPRLFGLLNLEVAPNQLGTIISNLKESGLSSLIRNPSISIIFVFLCAVAASTCQFLITKRSSPSDKKSSFKELLARTKAGEEVPQSEINAMSTGAMTKFMPIWMFIIMFNLSGALVFYYLLSNLVSLFQQKVVFKMAEDKMDSLADKAILKELKDIREAKVIKNKKTGTTITYTPAGDSSPSQGSNKKKRRK